MSEVAHPEALPAWRLEFYAPLASFRDPLFPGLARCLPVPPPSTVRGLFAAATGEPSESLAFGMAAWAEGEGADAETYHPIDASGLNPAVSGRVRAGKGGMTLRLRPFLTGVHLTVAGVQMGADNFTITVTQATAGGGSASVALTDARLPISAAKSGAPEKS